MTEKILLTVRETAERCAVSLRTVQRWIEEKELPVIRIARTVRVAVEDLDRFLKRHRE